MGGAAATAAAPFFFAEKEFHLPDAEPERLPDPKSRKLVVDGIFPRGLVHIIAGPVACGKTTLIMQMLDAIQKGEKWLGMDTYLTKIVYICADRDLQETRETIERLGLKIEMDIASLTDMKGNVIPYLETIITDRCKGGELVLVEPVNFFIRDGQNRIGDINNIGHVSNFLLKIKRLAAQMNLTIIGSLHSSKAKVGEGYMTPREKVMGSIAWTAFTSTTIIIEPVDPKTPEDPGRTIYVLPRNLKPFTLDYVVDEKCGLLISVAQVQRGMRPQLEICLDEWEGQFSSADVDNWQVLANVSRATARRWLSQKVENGYVEVLERGRYRKRGAN